MTLHVAGLPEELRRRGQLLLASLAVRYSPDSRLGSVLAAPEFNPLLYLPRWALADIKSSGDYQSIEFPMAVAAAFEFAAADLLYTDKGKVATSLAHVLDDVANSLFMSAVGEDELFWDTKNSTWQHYSAVLASLDVDLNQLIEADRAVAVHAIVGASIDVVAESGGRISSAVPHLGAALAIERDLASLRADLEAGSTTIATIAARAAAGSIDDPELIYLVAASRHVHRYLIDLALEQAREALDRLSGLPRLSAHVVALIDRLGRTRGALGSEASMAAHPLPRGSRTAGMGKRMAAAVEHARRFLLADPALNEAREVHRRVGLVAPEMTSIFPMVFPLQALARCGEPVGDRVDFWLEEMASRSFSYYDNPRVASLDADTVGAVLRLWKYSSHVAHTSSIVDPLIRRTSAALEDRDRIPVWLERPIERHIRLTGGTCAAVEANFLVGLIEASADIFPKIGARPLARLLSDFAARGTSDAVDYVDDYLLVPISRLLVHQHDASDAARDRLSSEIERRAEASSAQTIAFLIMATSNHPEMEIEAWSWIDVLVRSQRYDGGWDAEPLFWVNGFGGAPEWFRSRTVTTSFCYEALSLAVSTR